MHIKLRNRLEELKKGPRSRLPMFVGKKPIYYVDGRKSVLCPTCANDVCSEWTDDDSPLDLPIEFHVAWFTEQKCSVCDDLIKGLFEDEEPIVVEIVKNRKGSVGNLHLDL